MRALLCSNLFPLDTERSGNGATVAVRQLAEGARSHGVDIHQVVRFRPLLTGAGLQWPAAASADGFEVLDVPVIGTRRCFSATLTRLASPRIARIPTPDAIVCHMVDSFVPARRVFRRGGAKSVFVLHAPDLEHPQLRWCLARADAVLCRSAALRRQLAERTGVLAHGVVSSGIPESEFGGEAKDLGDGPLRIVIAAVFVAFKHIPATLQALELLATQGIDFSVEVFGDGPLRAQTAALAAVPALQGRVRLHGFRPKPEVLRAMRDAHLFVMPSAPETLGLAFLEAMANGCVVVGHAGWGVDGIVEDGVNGFLVDDASPAAIADKVLAYLGSDRPALHRRSFETATRHTADAAAANYASLIRSVA